MWPFLVQQNAGKRGDGNKKLKYFYGDDEKTYKIRDRRVWVIEKCVG